MISARGVAKVAEENRAFSREALYKATGPQGNPTLTTLMGIVCATGLKLSAKAG